jgi:hypothetical protein
MSALRESVERTRAGKKKPAKRKRAKKAS